MGLFNDPTTFQTLINRIFHDVIDKFMVIYMDDLFIFCTIETDHLQHVEEEVKRLKEQDLYVSPKTFHSWKSK